MKMLLQQALEGLPAFIVVDDKQKVVYANKRFSSLLGIMETELIGKKATDFILEDGLTEVMKEKTEKNGVFFSLLPYKRTNQITILCNCKPMIQNDVVIGAVLVQATNHLPDVMQKIHFQNGFTSVDHQKDQMKVELKHIAKSKSALDWIIGKSESIQEIKQLIQSFSKSGLSVLITGETGVGKEIFAKVIHMLKHSTLENFVKINCAAMKEEWLESEIFDYLSDPYAAEKKREIYKNIGFMQKGTLFLDEVTELSLSFQAKLLQVLQDKEVEQNETVPSNIRIICCTNQKIEQLIEDGKFRRDLYYRINTIEIVIPPLKERKEDIDKLCQYFIEKINRENAFHVKGMETEVIRLFHSYDWPGNVRELKHVMQRLAILNPEGLLRIKDCGFIQQKMGKGTNCSETITCETLSAQRTEIEKKAIINALREANYNKTKAAQILNIDRSALYKKMKRYQLQDEKKQSD